MYQLSGFSYSIPSGKPTKHYGKSPSVRTVNPIFQWAIFNSYVSHYQKVIILYWVYTGHILTTNNHFQLPEGTMKKLILAHSWLVDITIQIQSLLSISFRVLECGQDMARCRCHTPWDQASVISSEPPRK